MSDFKEKLRLLSANCRANDTLSKFACFREEADAIDMALARIAALEQELRNIANADTVAWDDPTEFEAWAKNRARVTLANQQAREG